MPNRRKVVPSSRSETDFDLTPEFTAEELDAAIEQELRELGIVLERVDPKYDRPLSYFAQKWGVKQSTAKTWLDLLVKNGKMTVNRKRYKNFVADAYRYTGGEETNDRPDIG